MDSNAFQLHLATAPLLDDILRDGARRALQAAIEEEVDDYIQRHRQHLEVLHQRIMETGYVQVTSRRFLILARKP